MIRPYKNYTEIEVNFKANAPSTIYKYRDWSKQYHQKIITENEIWFAHPFELNDPYDVRPPHNIIDNIDDWPAFRRKLEQAGRNIERGISEEEFQQLVDERFIKAKQDIRGYFLGNRKEYILKEENYDRLGVFSCCISGLNEAMWAHYGNNHCGFAIGFDALQLMKAIRYYWGFVEYNDSPVEIDLNLFEINNEQHQLKILNKELFQKATKWSMEEEFRFVTASIGITRQRACQFPVECLSEILIGANTSEEVLHSIVQNATLKRPNIPIYKVARKMDSYGFEKRFQIN